MITEVSIKICEKEYQFKRLKNKEILQITKEVRDFFKKGKELEEMEKKVKESESILQRINSLNSLLEVQYKKYENEKSSKKKEQILLKQEELLEKIMDYEDDLKELEKELEWNDEDNIVYVTETLEAFALKLDKLLINFDKEYFVENCNPADMVVARNIDKYYNMAFQGSSTEDISREIDKDFKESEERGSN